MYIDMTFDTAVSLELPMAQPAGFEPAMSPSLPSQPDTLNTMTQGIPHTGWSLLLGHTVWEMTHMS